MVADDEKFEGRLEVEVVLPHEARGDPVAAGQRLDLGFVPAAAFLRLLRNDQACAVQLGQVGRVSLVAAGEKSVHVGDGGVIAKYFGNGVEKRPLAVCAGAVGKHEFVLDRKAGAAVADIALQEVLQLGVVVGDARKKLRPQRVRRAGRRCRAGGLLGEVVERVRRATCCRCAGRKCCRRR